MTFNRSEQIAILALSAALLVGGVITLIETWWPEEIEEFEIARGAVPVPDMPAKAPAEDASAMTSAAPRPSDQAASVIDINAASAAELIALPRIGPRTAARIVAYRRTHGPFGRIEDLMSVKGIGPKTFEGLKAMVSAGSP